INRERKSSDMDFVMPGWPPRPAGRVNQIFQLKGIPLDSVRSDNALGHGQSSFTLVNFDCHMTGTEPSAAEKKSAVWTDIDNAFSRPVTLSDDAANYVPTQILAELFRSQGYDAIAYKSQFGEDEGFNIAVFDPSAVEIVACAPYKVKSIKVEAEQIGNDWFRSPVNHPEIDPSYSTTSELPQSASGHSD
ncbi:MAG TPA: RES family NAD+ phosphorylase, partial [Sphingobium sp.]|uniref:RES family NAD+ phosphorylase n=1 Tax=Sphingobium sp. TaxID=1912891 RepID=UPI002ED07489